MKWNGSSWVASADNSGGGSGTVTSITAGTGLTGGAITTSGTIGLDTELAGLNGLATTGFMKRTAAGSYSTVASVDLTNSVTGDRFHAKCTTQFHQSVPVDFM